MIVFRHNASLFLILALTAFTSACTERASTPPDEVPLAESDPSCNAPGVRAVVEQLGERLNKVPLLAPDSIVVREIRESYASLVTPDLLGAWIADPASAPGREVSSPWPERIEILAVEAEGGACRVEGEVVYVTSAEMMQTEAAVREPVTLRVMNDGVWRVSSYEAVAPPTLDPTTASADAVPPQEDTMSVSADAADVLRRYYVAIDARDFRRAYRLWGNGGGASGQTYEEFEAGFAETAHVEVDIGEPGRVEPAAGSRYVEVPVVVRAVAVSGEQQRFEGTYTLRRSVVKGATAEQRRWHLYSAEITRVR